MNRMSTPARSPFVRMALAMAFSLFVVGHMTGQDGDGPPQMPPAPVTTVRAEAGAFAQAIRLTGNVEPLRRATISSEIGGALDEVHADEGDRVVEGQILARHRLAPHEFAFQQAKASAMADQQSLQELEAGTRVEDLAIARAEYDEAKVRAEMAEREYERSRALFQEGTISEGEYDVSRENWESRRAQREVLKAALERAEAGPRSEELAVARARAASSQAAAELAQDRLERATIRAPFDGVITRKYAEVGSWLASGDELFDLEADDTVRIVVDVPETYFHAIDLGMTVEVRFDALPRESFQGQVTVRVPKASPRSRAFPVKIDIVNQEHRLASGMLARLEFQPATPEQQSTVIHKDALVPMLPNPIVYKVTWDEANTPIAQMVEVTTGRYFGQAVEVFGDIEDGDQIVIRGNERLRPGQPLILNAFISESQAAEKLRNQAERSSRD